MKKIILLLISIFMLTILTSYVYATDENDENMYIYKNESGEIVGSNQYELDDDAVLIDNTEDYENLYNSGADKHSHEDNKKGFEEQLEKLRQITENKLDEKLVITSVLSEIKQEYTTDYYYYYLIQYQLVKVRDSSGKESTAVVILSYDVAENKSLKPLKEGDTIYGYIQYVGTSDAIYNMIDHGLKDEEIAYVSLTSQDRTLGVVLLSIFTTILLCLYAGKHGVKLLIPLFVILDLLFVVLVPQIELGTSILLISILSALEFIILICTLKNGWSRKNFVSILSSICVVTLVTALGALFANANCLTGKGILSEELYDLNANVYYIETTINSLIGTYDIYISIIILISSIVTATISSRLTELSEKYAGSNGMVNSIVEEAKKQIADYPIIISGIFLIMYLPTFIANYLNKPVLEYFINSESLVTSIAIWLLTIISSIIIAPVTAVVSYLIMGKVEIKQISQ